MSKRDRVLVVDEVTDTAEVLQAVLEPRGLTVNRVSRLDPGVPSVEPRPAVVVLNAEAIDAANCHGWEGWRSVPQVIIGTVRMSPDSTRDSANAGAQRRYLQKPFQFADLIHAIEALIAGPKRTKRDSRVNK